MDKVIRVDQCTRRKTAQEIEMNRQGEREFTDKMVDYIAHWHVFLSVIRAIFKQSL